MSNAYITTLLPLSLESAQGKQRAILERAKAQVGFIPNMYANMAHMPAVLDTYLHGYDLFRKQSGLSPVEQEVVFLGVSQVNGCTYCTAAHSMIADKVSKVPAEVLTAIRGGLPLPDAKLAALFRVTQELVRNLGKPAPESVKAFLAAGYQEQQLLAIILAISVKVLSNYSNHAFATPVDEAFAAYKVA